MWCAGWFAVDAQGDGLTRGERQMSSQAVLVDAMRDYPNATQCNKTLRGPTPCHCHTLPLSDRVKQPITMMFRCGSSDAVTSILPHLVLFCPARRAVAELLGGHKIKKKGAGEKGMVPPPLRARANWDARLPEAISWRRLLALTRKVKLYVNRAYYCHRASHMIRHMRAREPPVGIELTTCRLQGGRSGHLS